MSEDNICVFAGVDDYMVSDSIRPVAAESRVVLHGSLSVDDDPVAGSKQRPIPNPVGVSATREETARFTSASSLRSVKAVGGLGRHCMNITWQPAKNQLLEFDFLASVVDIDAHQIAFGIIIKHDTFGYFLAFDAGFFREIDVQRISLGVIIKFHGLNPLSGKAL
jgi:hypothetical protein